MKVHLTEKNTIHHLSFSHSAFSSPAELVQFIAQLRDLSEGLPVGIKLSVGQPREIAAFCKAITEIGVGPDFITVDGAEGGTGAAPPEFSDSIGLPLEEGLVIIRNMLVGAGLRDKLKIIALGRVTNGFSCGYYSCTRSRCRQFCYRFYVKLRLYSSTKMQHKQVPDRHCDYKSIFNGRFGPRG